MTDTDNLKLRETSTIENAGYLANDTAVLNILKKNFPKHEKLETGVYVDTKGIPTMGAGVALAEIVEKTEIDENGKKTTREVLQLYPLSQLNKEIGYSGSKHKITPAQYEAIQKKLTNFRDLKTRELRLPEPKEVTDIVLPQTKHIKFTEDEVKKQLNKVLPDRLKLAEHAAKKAEVKLQGLSAEVRAAAADLYYRGGKRLIFGEETPKVNAALKNVDINGFLVELLYDSHDGHQAGNYVRGYDYAKPIFDKMSEEEKKTFKEYTRKNVPEDAVKAAKKALMLENAKRQKNKVERVGSEAFDPYVPEKVYENKPEGQKAGLGEKAVPVKPYPTPHAAEGSDGITDAHMRTIK